MPAFQMRHYQAIAQLLQDARTANDDGACQCDRCADAAAGTTLDDIERRFADLFRGDNTNFNLGLFQQACKPGANVNARKVK